MVHKEFLIHCCSTIGAQPFSREINNSISSVVNFVMLYYYVHRLLFGGEFDGRCKSASTPSASPLLLFFLALIFVLILLFAGSVGTVKAKGTVYLSNIRMVFVSIKPVENFIAFDMPLVCISYFGV